MWGANIHLLRTVDLDPAYGAKTCIECLYAPGRGCTEEQSGQFGCCQDGSFCPTANVQNNTAKNYYLQYTVTWRLFDGANDLPVDIFVLDASNCQVEYNIADTNKTGLSLTQLSWQVPVDYTFVFSVGHLHIGGINITLDTKSPTADAWTTICTSYPKYGSTPGKAGDEDGYLTQMSACDGINQVLKEKDLIRVTSWYNVAEKDPRTWNAGAHGGVMSLFYVAGVPN